MNFMTPREAIKSEIEKICKRHGVNRDNFIGEKRRLKCLKREVFALQEICDYLRQHMKWSYQRIGEFLGRDHSTVMWHLKNKIKNDAK